MQKTASETVLRLCSKYSTSSSTNVLDFVNWNTIVIKRLFDLKSAGLLQNLSTVFLTYPF